MYHSFTGGQVIDRTVPLGKDTAHCYSLRALEKEGHAGAFSCGVAGPQDSPWQCWTAMGGRGHLWSSSQKRYRFWLDEVLDENEQNRAKLKHRFLKHTSSSQQSHYISTRQD